MDGTFDEGVEAGCPDDETKPRRSGASERNVHPSNDLARAQPRPKQTFQPPKPPLTFLSYDDMVNLPDPEWLIEGLILQQTSALMFGKSNSFKSFLAIDIACHVGLACETDRPFGAELTHWHGHKMGSGWSVL